MSAWLGVSRANNGMNGIHTLLIVWYMRHPGIKDVTMRKETIGNFLYRFTILALEGTLGANKYRRMCTLSRVVGQCFQQMYHILNIRASFEPSRLLAPWT